MEYIYDTQLLLEGKDLSDQKIIDDELIKLHFHTNTPWKVLEYCATLGEVYDVVIENMRRQAEGLQG